MEYGVWIRRYVAAAAAKNNNEERKNNKKRFLENGIASAHNPFSGLIRIECHLKILKKNDQMEKTHILGKRIFKEKK